MARPIISTMERRNSFIEGYCGTCVVSLNIDECFEYHICIDEDPAIINFWNILQVEGNRLYKFLANVEYSEENFQRAKKHLRDHPDVSGDLFFHSAMYFICNRMSRSGDMNTFGWSDRLRKGLPEYISAYKSAISSLPAITNKIKDIEFVCGDYIEYMQSMKWNEISNVCSYIDPPYMHSSRSSCRPYGVYEYSDEDHNNLLYFITKCCKGLTYIGGYSSPLYNDALAAYKQHSWKISNSASQKKNKPIMNECLWCVDHVV